MDSGVWRIFQRNKREQATVDSPNAEECDRFSLYEILRLLPQID